MPNDNHYEILGLNWNGCNAAGEKYSAAEINVAYKQAALKYHPDRNQDNDTTEKFKQVAKSHEILIDPEKRDAFDQELKNNPDVFTNKKHLFVTLNGKTHAVFDDIIETNDLAIVPLAAPDTDLTQLIINSECEPAKILEIAKENLIFARAIFDNGRTLALLALSQQFELLLIIYDEFIEVEQRQSDSLKEFLEIPNAKQLIEHLTNRQKDYEIAFVFACQQYPETAERFIQALFQEHTNKKSPPLSYATLLRLSKKSHFAAHSLILFYADKLSLSKYEFVLQSHPDKKDEFLELFQKKANSEIKKKREAYKVLSEKIRKNGISIKILERNSVLIRTIGAEAFSLTSDNVFKFTILNILIANETIESFTGKYSSAEQKQFATVLVNALISYSNNCQPQTNITLGNLDIMKSLLEQIDFNDFKQLLSNMSLEIFENQGLEEIINFILKRKDSIDEKPFFLQLLLKEDRHVYNFLENNLSFLRQFFKTLNTPDLYTPNVSDYQDEISKNKIIQTRLAILAAKHGIDVSTIVVTPFLTQFVDICRAAGNFYSYIHSRGTPANIEYDKFISLFEQTGFFDDLLLINTSDLNIKFELVKAALAKLNSSLDGMYQSQAHPELLSERLTVILMECSKIEPLINIKDNNKKKEMRDTLLTLCCSSKTATLLMKQIEHGIAGAYVFDSFILNMHLAYLLITNPSWSDQYFTAGVAHRWHEVFETQSFKMGILKSFNIFNGIDYKDIGGGKSYSDLLSHSPLSRYQSQQFVDLYFLKVCQDFKATLLAKYPTAFFSRFLLLVGSNQFKNKLLAYSKLDKFLEDIQFKPVSALDMDLALKQLLELLHSTKIDNEILVLLQEALLNNKPDLLAATLTVVNETARFKVPKALQNRIESYLAGLKLTKPLELTFLDLAERHIEKYHNAVSGDSLLAIYCAHGEKILPFVTRYGLQAKLVMIEQLDSVLTNVRHGANQFNHQEVDEQQTIKRLLKSFEDLVNKTAMDIEKLTCTQLALEYHAELVSTVKKNNIDNPRLHLLIDTFPEEQSQNLLLWLISLVMKKDFFAKKTLISYLDNSSLRGGPRFIQHIDGNLLVELAEVSVDSMRIILNDVALCSKISEAPQFKKDINYTWFDKFFGLPQCPEIGIIKELEALQSRLDEINSLIENNEKELNEIFNERQLNVKLEKLSTFQAKLTKQTLIDKISEIEKRMMELKIDNNLVKKITQTLQNNITTTKLDRETQSNKLERNRRFILLFLEIEKSTEQILTRNNELQGYQQEIDGKIDGICSEYLEEALYNKSMSDFNIIKQNIVVVPIPVDLKSQIDQLKGEDNTLDLSTEFNLLQTNHGALLELCQSINNKIDQKEKTLTDSRMIAMNKRAQAIDQLDTSHVALIRAYLDTGNKNGLKVIVNSIKFSELHAIFSKLAGEELIPNLSRYSNNRLHDCKRNIYVAYYQQYKSDNKRIAIAAIFSIIPVAWLITMPYIFYKLCRRKQGIQISEQGPDKESSIKSFREKIKPIEGSSYVKSIELLNKRGELKKERYSCEEMQRLQDQRGRAKSKKSNKVIVLSSPQQQDRMNLLFNFSNKKNTEIVLKKLRSQYDASKRESTQVVNAHPHQCGS